MHAQGRTKGMADYLSRHPSESNSNEQKIKAEELWNNWCTVNEITRNDVFDLANQKSQANNNRPTRAKLARTNKLAGESERQASER